MHAAMRYLFLLLSVPQGAFAGAWLPPKHDGKLIATGIEQTQKKQNIEHFSHRETYRSLLLEYGLSDGIGPAVKSGEQKRALPQGNKKSSEARLGLLIDTPGLATGLLPPFSYRLAKAALPFKNIDRQKRAAMTLGLDNDVDESWTALAFADRITINKFRMTQEVEFDRIRSTGRDWRTWLYRFSLGYDRIDIGSEATYFKDYAGGYHALAHSGFAQWTPPAHGFQLRVKYGERRPPMGQLSIQKNDYLTLEIEFNF